MLTSVYVTGHRDLTAAEFEEHYVPQLAARLCPACPKCGGHQTVVVGHRPAQTGLACDACNWLWAGDRVNFLVRADDADNRADTLAVVWLQARGAVVDLLSCAGYSDDEFDAIALARSSATLGWVRPGREGDRVARNLARTPTPGVP